MLNTKPKISIIIPTYNRAHLIGETLDSVLAQTYVEWECIIVDDGSTDNTREVVKAFTILDKRFSYYARPKNLRKGSNTCRNFGFKKSKADYIKWFDSDDILMPEHFEKCLNPFFQNIDLDLVICEIQTFKDVLPSSIENNNIVLENFELKKFVLRKQFFQTGSALWKRSFLCKLMGYPILFDPELTQSQDYDFHSRALIYRPKIKKIYERLYYFRRGNISISSEFKVSSDHVNSFLKVKFKLGELFKEDNEILLGLFNHVLDSLRNTLSMANKEVFEIHINTLKKWQVHFKLMPNYKIYFLIYLSRLLFKIGKGSYFFKFFYQIKKIS